MKILKAYKFRIYPSKEQAIFIDKVFNDTRFIWNSLVTNFNSYGTPNFKDKFSEKVANQRKWLLHNISSALVEVHDIICLEDLNIEGMKKGYLGKSISDASLAELVRMIEYKATWYGKTVVKVDRFYPSSKTCSCCGSVKKNLSLEDRIYVCNECGFKMDRDLNASRNILDQGLKVLDLKSVELIDYSRGEEIRLGRFLHSTIASSMKRL
jgi:IS605 OrfB family transposase